MQNFNEHESELSWYIGFTHNLVTFFLEKTDFKGS